MAANRPLENGQEGNADSGFLKSAFDKAAGLAASKAAQPVGELVEEPERAVIRDGMTPAQADAVLRKNSGSTVVYYHDGGRFEITEGLLYRKEEAPGDGSDRVDFGKNHVICAKFIRGIL